MNFAIEGRITGKGRPRATRTGRIYTPAQTESYECIVRNEYRRAGGVYHEGPIRLRFTVKFAISKADRNSKGLPNKRGIEKLEGRIRPMKKPDFDNVEKIIADALIGLAYEDDSHVVSSSVEKIYAERESVEVEIEEI